MPVFLKGDILCFTVNTFEPSEFLSVIPKVVRLIYDTRSDKFRRAEELHDHWLLFAVERGRWRYGVGKLSGEASFGDVVFCPPNTPFVKELISPLGFFYILFDWTTRKGHSLSSSNLLPVGKVRLADTSRLSSTFTFLKTLYQQSNPFYLQLEHHQLSNHLLYDLICQHNLETKISSSGLAQDSVIADPVMKQAAKSIRVHAFSTLSMKALAASLELSPVQLTRRFRAAWGITPIAYLTHLRVQKAKTLLLETDFSLEDIAKSCGYEDGFYLSRVFYKATKMRPSFYRKTHRI